MGVLVWFHGGGWVVGDLDGFDRVARSMANAAGHVVVSVDYRLAPEHPFPAAVDDAELAVRWAAGDAAERLGYDPARRAVGGDSAGGQLAAAAAHRRPGRLRAQLLVYPALDPLMASASYGLFEQGPFLTRAQMEACWSAYLAGADGMRASALAWGDYTHLPPAWIALAGVDPLRDDGAAYAELLRSFGVAAQVTAFEDMPHGFLRWGGVADRQRELVAWLGAAARSALS
jgi:acetyl esterase